jgi:hypothetical protein
MLCVYLFYPDTMLSNYTTNYYSLKDADYYMARIPEQGNRTRFLTKKDKYLNKQESGI